jgi:CRP-like cAMP-binding protein
VAFENMIKVNHLYRKEIKMSEEIVLEVPVFSVDTSRFSSLAFSASASTHAIDHYADLDLSSDERLLFQIMADPNLMATLFDAGSVLAHKDEFIETGHVVVSGTVEIIHTRGNFLVGPGAVIGLSEGLLGLKATSTVRAVTAVNTRMIPMHTGALVTFESHRGIKSIFRSLIARILHISVFPNVLK